MNKKLSVGMSINSSYVDENGIRIITDATPHTISVGMVDDSEPELTPWEMRNREAAWLTRLNNGDTVEE